MYHKINNFIKENFTEDIKYFENKNKIKIEFVDDNSLIIPDYKIDFQNKSKKTIEKIESLSKLENLQTSIRISVGLFTTEIYANWIRKEELERWV